MRLVLLIVLSVALSTAFPQQEGRTRTRGSRRFSIATPGLQSTSRKETTAEAAEETLTPDIPEEPRTRSRGVSLLRRGRPSLGPRSRTSPQTQEVQEPVEKKVEDTPSKNLSVTRGGLRIRRPLKKPTTKTPTTTTTTTTTTLAPEVETPVSKPNEDVPVEEPKTVMKAVVSDSKMSKFEAEPTPEKEKKDETKPVEVSKPMKPKLKPRPKLRPIPIKLRQRGQLEDAAKEAPAETQMPKAQEITPSVSEPTSSHRFSTRPRLPRIQGRIEGRRGRQPEAQSAQELKEAAEEPIETLVTKRPRSRNPSTRTSRRRFPVAAPEKAPAETQTVKESPAVQETVSRSERFGRRSRIG